MRSFDDFPSSSPEGRFFTRLDILDTSTVLPLVLLLFREQSIDPSRRRRALTALESWLVRRGLMRLTAQTYNREVPRLVAKVAEDPERADEVIIEHLRAAAGQSSRWPDDEEFTRFLTSQSLYGLVAQKRLVMALSAVEEAMHKDKGERAFEPGLSLEHVMPQRWETHSPLAGGAGRWGGPGPDINCRHSLTDARRWVRHGVAPQRAPNASDASQRPNTPRNALRRLGRTSQKGRKRPRVRDLLMAGPRFELGTPRFSVVCSTN